MMFSMRVGGMRLPSVLVTGPPPEPPDPGLLLPCWWEPVRGWLHITVLSRAGFPVASRLVLRTH